MFGMPILQLLLLFAPWIVGLGGGLYLGLRLVRAFERRTSSRKEIEEVQERMLRLEESNAAMAERMERLAEGQEFTSKLLAERK